MLKTHHLRDFVAIANASSIRSAARELNLAQPAMTRSLRDLEAQLGVSLIQRHARGVVLTAEGERFLSRAQLVLSELQSAIDDVTNCNSPPAGKVSVALSGAAILTLLPDAFATFRQTHGAVDLKIVEGIYPKVEPLLRDGQIDFYIGPRPPRVATVYKTQLLFHNTRFVFARPDHPMRYARNLSDLKEMEWFVPGPMEREANEVENIFQERGLGKPKMTTRMDSMLGLLLLLSKTDALSLMPRQWADIAIFKNMISPILLDETFSAPDLVLITRAASPLTPAAERLSDLLQRGLADITSRQIV